MFKKTIIYLALIFLIFNNYSFCNEMLVISQIGLNLRDKPTLEGKIINVIPFKEKVKILEETNNEISINGVKGKWVKVNWNNYNGWVFNGYLRFQVNNSIFNYYNFIPHAINNNLINKSFLNKIDNKNFNENNKLKINLVSFNKLPPLLPGDDVVIIEKNKILSDKINMLYLAKYEMDSEISYFLLKYNLLKYKLNDNTSFVIIKKKNINNYPTLNLIKNIDDKTLLDSLIKQLYNINNFNNYNVYKDDYFKSDYKNYNNYNCSEIILKDTNTTIHLLEYNGVTDSYCNFISVFINQKLSLISHASLIFSFKMNDNIYLYFFEWVPHSEGSKNVIYKVLGNKLIEEKKL